MQAAFDRWVDAFFVIPQIQARFPAHMIQRDFAAAPHPRPRALVGHYAVYAFFHGHDWLKVGHATYPQRFSSQHYGIRRAGSTLAKDIWAQPGRLGYQGDENGLGGWMLDHLGRANVLVPQDWGKPLVALLEHWLILQLAPRFEGRRA